MALPVPYITHTPRLRKTREGYLVDHQTEEFLQITRLLAGLGGGPTVYYGGSVMVSDGHPILGRIMQGMGIACSVYHLGQYVMVLLATEEMGEAPVRTNTKGKPSAQGRSRLSRIVEVAKALRPTKVIPIPEDAYTEDDD